MNFTRRRAMAAAATGTALALALGVLATTGASANDDPLYTVSVSDAAVTVGDVVDVTVVAGSLQDVYAYSVDLGYDPALLEFVADSATTKISGATYEKASSGSVKVTHTKLGSSPAASGEDIVLVTAKFKAIGNGSATISASDLASVSTDVVSSTTSIVGSAVVGIAKAAAPATNETSPGTVAKASTKTSLGVKSRSIKRGKKLTTTVKVTAPGVVPAGTLTFKYRGKTVRRSVKLVNGKATVVFRPRALGHHTLRVTFVPSKGFGGSTDTVKIRVKK